MSDTVDLRVVVPSVRLLVALNAVGIAAAGVGVWGMAGGPPDCKVYCGPMPNMFLALAMLGVGAVVWFAAVVIDALAAVNAGILPPGRARIHARAWPLALLAVHVGLFAVPALWQALA